VAEGVEWVRVMGRHQICIGGSAEYSPAFLVDNLEVAKFKHPPRWFRSGYWLDEGATEWVSQEADPPDKHVGLLKITASDQNDVFKYCWRCFVVRKTWAGFTVNEQAQMAISVGLAANDTTYTLQFDSTNIWVMNGQTPIEMSYSWDY
jgi:hypothetical protein